MRLKNKVAIVTGGARNIGRSIATEFAKEGAIVVIADILMPEAENTVKEISSLGHKCIVLRTNVSNYKDVQEMVSTTLKEFRKIDILANIAGIDKNGTIIDFPVNIWNDIMSVNLKGTFLCCKAVGKVMREQKSGKIINMASIDGRNAEMEYVAYSASKFGVIGFTQGMALEMAQYGVNVNALAPGPTCTDMMQQFFIKRAPTLGLTPEQFKNKFESIIPLCRMGTPEDIAKLAVFLASEDSNYITGQTIVIDGGYELTRPVL